MRVSVRPRLSYVKAALRREGADQSSCRVTCALWIWDVLINSSA